VVTTPTIAPAAATPVIATAIPVPAPQAKAPAATTTVAKAPAATVHSAPAPIKAQPAPAPAVAGTALVLHAASPPPSSKSPTRPVNELTTISGSVYKNVEVERVMANGIVISYTPAGGGWAMTKINFEDLSPEIRLKYEK
jgi:hypothetical protein